MPRVVIFSFLDPEQNPDLLTYPPGKLSGSRLCPAMDLDHFDHLRL